MRILLVLFALGLGLANPVEAIAQGNSAQSKGLLIVQDVDEERLKVLLAFTAWGDEANLQRLSAAASSFEIANERCDEDARRGLMVSMLPGPKQGARGGLYREAVAGTFGKLEVEVALLGVAEMQKGEGLDAGTAQAPTTIGSVPD